MAIREIRVDGDECLRKRCREVDKFDERLEMLLDDMWDTLHKANGMGLAAPQVGILKRIAVIESEDEHYELINPTITYAEGTLLDREACLSVPNLMGEVERPETIKVVALDRYGKEKKYNISGYLARCFCHEIDHLDGILYTDKVIRYIDPEEEE